MIETAMRIEISDRLESAIMTAAKLAPPRGPRPELQHLTLIESDQGSKLGASDGELTMSYRFDADPRPRRSARIPAHRVAQILRLQDGTSTLEVDGGSCVIVGDGCRFELVAQELPDACSIPRYEWEDGESLTIEPEILTELVQLVAYAASREQTRFNMQAIRLELSAGKLEAIATDGKRLALASIKIDTAAELEAQVSALGLAAAVKVLGDLAPNERVEVKLAESMLILRAGDLELSLLTGSTKFAPFRSVIPSSSKYQVEFDRLDLMQALKLASLVNTRESIAIRMRFASTGVTISSNVADVGSSAVELPAMSIEADLELGFNPSLVVEGLRACSCSSVLFAFSNADSAAVITCAESVEGRPDLLYVLMPINLGS